MVRVKTTNAVRAEDDDEEDANYEVDSESDSDSDANSDADESDSNADDADSNAEDANSNAEDADDDEEEDAESAANVDHNDPLAGIRSQLALGMSEEEMRMHEGRGITHASRSFLYTRG